MSKTKKIVIFIFQATGLAADAFAQRQEEFDPFDLDAMIDDMDEKRQQRVSASMQASFFQV